MKRVIEVKKQGEVYTVYEDGGKTLPIPSFEAEPPGFPRTFVGKGQLMAEFPGSEFVFVEAAKKAALSTRTPSTQPAMEIALAPKRIAPSNYEMLALNYFQRLVDRLHWCAEDMKPVVKVQVEATAETIIELMPELQEKLKVMLDRGGKGRIEIL